MPDPVGGREPGTKPLLRTILGDVLRQIRLAQRRTLAEVARAARVSMPYLSELERGRKEASSEVLAAICEALEVELSDLLTEVGHQLARTGTVVELDAFRAFRAHRAALPRRAARPGQAVPRRRHRPGDVQLLAA